MPWLSGIMEKYKISIKWQEAILHSLTLELQSFSSTENLASFHTINRRTFYFLPKKSSNPKDSFGKESLGSSGKDSPENPSPNANPKNSLGPSGLTTDY